MSQALRINANDPRIMYKGEWVLGESSAVTQVPNEFCFLFRGTVHT